MCQAKNGRRGKMGVGEKVARPEAQQAKTDVTNEKKRENSHRHHNARRIELLLRIMR